MSFMISTISSDSEGHIRVLLLVFSFIRCSFPLLCNHVTTLAVSAIAQDSESCRATIISILPFLAIRDVSRKLPLNWYDWAAVVHAKSKYYPERQSFALTRVGMYYCAGCRLHWMAFVKLTRTSHLPIHLQR